MSRNRKITPITLGGNKTNRYKILDCSIKFSKKVFTGTTITNVINIIAKLLLPKIKTPTINITILNITTNKQYKYKFTYKFNQVNGIKLLVNNHNQFLLVNKNKFIVNTKNKNIKYLNKSTKVSNVKSIDKSPYLNKITKTKLS